MFKIKQIFGSSSKTIATDELGSDHLENSERVTRSLDKVNPDVGDEDVTGLKLLSRSDFHFLTWSYIFCASLQLIFQVG